MPFGSPAPWNVQMSKWPGTVVLADDCQVVSDSIHLTLWRALSDVHGPPMATGVLPLLAQECGTLCQPELRQSDSLGQFKRRLKTHLFGLWDHSA